MVLGSYSRRDEDLPDVGPHRSGWTVVFRKAPPANSTGRLMPGDCWIGWYSIVRTRVFSLTVWFQSERFEALLAVNIMEHAFSFHGAGGECHVSRDLRTSNGGSNLSGDEELAWCFMTWSSGM